MSSEERRKILQMVEDGKISAVEAATLMRTLDEDTTEAEVDVIENRSGPGCQLTRGSCSRSENLYLTFQDNNLPYPGMQAAY